MKAIGIRDNICIKSEEITAGSKMLEGFISPYNATVVEKIKEKSIEIKRIEMSEFGFDQDSNIKEFFANNVADVAVVTDINGDIARNSVESNLVGIKPTFGLVSRYGVITTAPSLEQVGVIGKTIEDCVEALKTIKGYDEKDSGSMKVEGNVNAENIKTASTAEIQIKNLKYAIPAHLIISTAEASSNLGRLDGIRYGYRTENANDLKDVYRNTREEGFGYEAKKKMLAGTFFLDVKNRTNYYVKAQKVRTVIKREMDEIFESIDVLITPITEEYTCLANLTGRPALTINNKLYIGKHFEEEKLVKVAKEVR